jgi:hypothetical protein
MIQLLARNYQLISELTAARSHRKKVFGFAYSIEIPAAKWQRAKLFAYCP